MAKNQRWRTFEANRDHKTYQDELFKRYEIYLDLDWVNSWDEELIKMKEGKRGALYE